MPSVDTACCICASLLSSQQPLYTDSEKPELDTLEPRLLPCCQRCVCPSCLSRNSRFRSYCPFCQISTQRSRLPQGLRDPPAYTSPPPSPRNRPRHSGESLLPEPANEELPAYSATDTQGISLGNGRDTKPAPDVIHHHLLPSDTLTSISLAYGVPAAVLRRHNALYSDGLLHARRTLSIPGSHSMRGVSLSPQPVESEEEIERKARIRRFMVGAKCHDYEVAGLYLRNAEGDVGRALEVWKEDERWERENPVDEKRKNGGSGKAKRRLVGSGLTGQLFGS